MESSELSLRVEEYECVFQQSDTQWERTTGGSDGGTLSLFDFVYRLSKSGRSARC